MSRARNLRAGLLALLTTSLAVVATAQAADPAPSLSAAPMAFGSPQSLISAPDETMWALSRERAPQGAGSALVVQRVDRDRVLSRVALPGGAATGSLPTVRSPLTATADGGMALVLAQIEEPFDLRRTREVALVRLAAGGGPLSTSPLPAAALHASGFAIAADGAVWFARLCDGALYRHVPGGRTSVTRVPSADCGAADPRETNAVALAPDGSTWVVDLAHNLIVRAREGDRTRAWRPDADRCTTDTSAPPEVLANPRGGVLFSSEHACRGQVTPSGRLDLGFPYDGTGFVDANGTYWNGTRQVMASGWSRSGPLPSRMTATEVVQARDGSPWAIGGRYRSEGYRETFEDWWTDVQVATGAGARVGRWSLAQVLPSAGDRRHLYRLGSKLGPDGAIYGYGRGDDELQMIRVLPPGVGAPATPQARATRVLARDGRGLWLQLACHAERGRFCRGTVTLTGRGVVAQPARYALAGRSAAAVGVRLGDRAARALRRRGAVRTTAIVRSVGAGTTRKALVLRRGR